MDHFNVFETDYEAMNTEYFEGSGAGGRVLHQSGDGRHMTIVTHYPNGVRFRYGGDLDYFESFYVVRGHGSRTMPDGTVVPMKAGDVIFVRPGIDIDYVYSPDFIDVAFFWSEKELPASLSGGIAQALHRD